MAKLIKKDQDSMYKTVILAAMRSLELGAGAAKLVDAESNAKFTSIALKEICEDKVGYKIKQAKGK